MDRKSKILLVILAVLTLIPVSMSYYRFFISRDYDILTQVSCDIKTDSCYSTKECLDGTSNCDNPETKYYKILKIKASLLSFCNHNIESCNEPKCSVGELGCEYIKCNPKTQVGADSCGDSNVN